MVYEKYIFQNNYYFNFQFNINYFFTYISYNINDMCYKNKK